MIWICQFSARRILAPPGRVIARWTLTAKEPCVVDSTTVETTTQLGWTTIHIPGPYVTSKMMDNDPTGVNHSFFLVDCYIKAMFRMHTTDIATKTIHINVVYAIPCRYLTSRWWTAALPKYPVRVEPPGWPGTVAQSRILAGSRKVIFSSNTNTKTNTKSNTKANTKTNTKTSMAWLCCTEQNPCGFKESDF